MDRYRGKVRARQEEIKKMENIRTERMKRLDGPLSRKVQIKDSRAEGWKEELLKELIRLSDFSMDGVIQKWVLTHAKDEKEMVHIFQLLLQRALNQGRTFSMMEDVEGMKGPLDTRSNQSIGKVFTVGLYQGRFEKIEIRSCGVPIKKGRGKIICAQEVSLGLLSLEKARKDFNIFIKFYPGKPENQGQWETALCASIYSGLFNQAFGFPTFILGGIDSKGRINAFGHMDIPWERVLSEDKGTVLCPKDNMQDIEKVIRHVPSYNVVGVEHIDEVIEMLQ